MVIACIAWAYKRRRRSISGMKFHMEQGHFGINRMKIVIIEEDDGLAYYSYYLYQFYFESVVI